MADQVDQKEPVVPQVVLDRIADWVPASSISTWWITPYHADITPQKAFQDDPQGFLRAIDLGKVHSFA